MYFNDPYLMRDPLRMSRNRLLERITAPASEPVTLEEAKLYLRIDHDEEDALITDLITATRMMAESWLKRSLMTQSWKLAYDDGIPESVMLPMGPVTSISSLIVVNRNQSTQAIDEDVYHLDAAKNALVLDSVLFGHRIEISYVTGYGDAADVPLPIKQGMLAHMAALYDGRGEDGMPQQTVGLYLPFREVRL